MNSLTNQINLTDQQIDDIFTAIDCDVELGGEYGEPERFAITSDSLENFVESAKKHWRECGRILSKEVSGFKTKVFEGVQVKKGDQRVNVYVVDFGNVRVAVKF